MTYSDEPDWQADAPTGAAAAYALLACAFVLGLIIGGSVVATAGRLW